MNSSQIEPLTVSDENQQRQLTSPKSRKFKWHFVYYLLAVFDVLTVGTSLLLNHQLVKNYEESIEINQIWAERLQTYSELAQRVGAANAPGNDVFDSQDVVAETQRLEVSLQRFQEQMAIIRQDLVTNTDAVYSAPLLAYLDQVDAAMAEMTREANLIFSFVGQNQTSLAAQRMSSMDRAYAEATIALETLRSQVGQIQQQNLQQQKDQASYLKRYEYAIAAAVLLMVTSLTIYGHKLSKRMTEDSQIKEQLIEAQIKQNSELQLTLEDLHSTQTQMIHSEKMAALGQMVAGVAHEINNPLNFIHSNLNPIDEYTEDLLTLSAAYQEHYPNPPKALQEEIEAADLEFLKEDMTKLMQSMRVGTERIREIVKSLRNFSRLDESDCKAVDVHEGINNTIMILQHRLKGNSERPNIELNKDFGQFPLVECFAGQLNQVFMNLLANAIDALEESNQGRSYQDIVDNPNTIWIHTYQQDEGWIAIAIADNGAGMTKDAAARIFNPFFTTKAVGKGTGLGLAISHQIITERHQGKIWCDSTPGEGTKFVIKIPTLQPEAGK